MKVVTLQQVKPLEIEAVFGSLNVKFAGETGRSVNDYPMEEFAVMRRKIGCFFEAA